MKKSTSLRAWEAIQKELTPKEMDVFEKVQTFPGVTQRETAALLQVPVHTISGRFTSLEKKKVLITEGERFFPTDKKKLGHSMYYINKKKVKV
jgi:DNA-binding MarR family transcriptional regulator